MATTQPSDAYAMATQPSDAYAMATQPSDAYAMATQPSDAYAMVTQPSDAYAMATQPSNAYAMAAMALELICNHSPDNPKEYYRIRKNAKWSGALFVFDSLTFTKSCFKFDKDGIIIGINAGGNYKNVKDEWATRVISTYESPFKIGLAMTRSCGDNYLVNFGISQCPEIQKIDISMILSPLCLIVASDGVGDNWKNKEICEFLMKDYEVSSNKVAEKFMEENMIRANSNFGSSADNAICEIMYILP